jgi:hypothetical protein
MNGNNSGMSVIEVVVLMGLATLLAIGVATALVPTLRAVIGAAIECVVNDQCE